MDISQDMIAEVVERFIRTEYQVSDKDALFTRDAHLFDLGFVDSLGFTELIAFIETRFGIRLDDDHLFGEDFTTINGMSRVIGSLIDQSPLEPANSKVGNGLSGGDRPSRSPVGLACHELRLRGDSGGSYGRCAKKLQVEATSLRGRIFNVYHLSGAAIRSVPDEIAVMGVTALF